MTPKDRCGGTRPRSPAAAWAREATDHAGVPGSRARIPRRHPGGVGVGYPQERLRRRRGGRELPAPSKKSASRSRPHPRPPLRHRAQKAPSRCGPRALCPRTQGHRPPAVLALGVRLPPAPTRGHARLTLRGGRGPPEAPRAGAGPLSEAGRGVSPPISPGQARGLAADLLTETGSGISQLISSAGRAEGSCT